jgi:ubiquinone/menaquinone biosynthesis C-methylase UbiE
VSRPPARRPSFEARAPVYDRLRPQDEAWWRRFEVMVAEGGLRGQRVLDVGCGTGALAAALAEKALARVWGVEPSEGMRAVARERVPRGVGLKAGSAEALPFRDAWFDRVVMSLVIHLVDRPAALAEARRVLVPGGRIVIATFARGHFDRYWAAPWFPSLAEIDRGRFPDLPVLLEELHAAGFAGARAVPVVSHGSMSREEALARLRGRHISTFDLLDPAEVEEGIARAERELPETVVTVLDQAVVVADRP